MKQVVLIGDSIRKGYEKTVGAELDGWADVWGAEQNGGTSERVLEHLDEWAISRQPDIVHLNCGLHDLRREFGQDSTAVPLESYTENVRTILTRLQSETDAVVIWAMTTPVNEAWHHENKGFDRREADVVAYNDAAGGIAHGLGLAVNDLFAVITAAGRDMLLKPDGVHFQPEGYALLGQTVANCIRSVAE